MMSNSLSLAKLSILKFVHLNLFISCSLYYERYNADLCNLRLSKYFIRRLKWNKMVEIHFLNLDKLAISRKYQETKEWWVLQTTFFHGRGCRV